MARSIKVVFRQDLRGVAKAGDAKNVSAGYARNYLIPRNLAFLATPATLRQWETERQGWLAKVDRKRTDAEGLAQRIEGITCTIQAKTRPNGQLFGSVSKQEIAQALESQGLTISKSALLLNEPIKTIGMSSVSVRLGSGLQATLKIDVQAQN